MTITSLLAVLALTARASAPALLAENLAGIGLDSLSATSSVAVSTPAARPVATPAANAAPVRTILLDPARLTVKDGDTLEYAFDAADGVLDRYGRVLGVLVLDGEPLGATLVRARLAYELVSVFGDGGCPAEASATRRAWDAPPQARRGHRERAVNATTRSASSIS